MFHLIRLNSSNLRRHLHHSLSPASELWGWIPARVNPNGGAIALGHPLGATGAVLTTKAAYAMQNAEREYCIVSMCVGGGEGAAALFRRP